MGGKRKLAVPVVALLALSGGAAASPDLSMTFATCTGKLSAQLEHQWLLGDPTSDRTVMWRDNMASLLDAMTDGDNRVALLAARIEAKQAHAALLHRATFNRDSEDSVWADQRAAQQIAVCAGLLLI